MKRVLLVTLFLTVCFAVSAQKRFDFKTTQLANDLGIRSKFKHYRVLTVDLRGIFSELNANNGGFVEFNFEGMPAMQADLTETTLLAPGYFETIASRTGLQKKMGSTIRTFEGTLRNNGGKMSLTIDQHFFSAVISNPDRTLYIEQARSFRQGQDQETVILYDTQDVISENEAVQCGVEATEMKAAELRRSKNTARTMAGSCKVADLAIATDSSMFAKFGDAASVSAHVVAVMNNVAVLYRHEFDDNMEFRIVTIYHSQVNNSDPLSPVTASTSAGVLLGAFRTWGQAGNFNVDFDLGQFWTNRDFDGSTVGLAYVDVMCSGSRYHVLQDYSSSMSNLSVLTAHEMGHNFGASHDPGGSPFIMAPSVNATSEWSPVSRTAVSTGIASAACLGNCSGPIVPTFTLAPAAVCVGDSIHFKDKTVNGTTRSWTFPSGTPLNASEPRPVVKYPTPGVYDVTLASAGAAALVAKNAVVVGNRALNTAACAAPSGTAGNGGIRYFSLNTISSLSGNAAADGTKYVDRSCKYVTALTPNTAYDVTIQIGSSGSESPEIYESLKIYIDYNGDGVFDESTEKVSDSGGDFWRGTLGYNASSRPWLRFTTPNTVRTNKLLRMRVITDSDSPTDACYNPVDGQVEDFGVVFPDNAAALPVDLVSFSGKDMGKYALLEWKVVNESLMSRYVVERSGDAVHFSDIGDVVPQNGGSRRLAYELEDDQIGNASGYYYRLRMEDSDGSVKLSKIIYVGESGVKAGLTLRNCQTLIESSDIAYELITDTPRKVSIEILDLNGNRIKGWDRELGKGSNAAKDDVSDLDSGFYLLVVKSNGTEPIVRKVLRAR